MNNTVVAIAGLALWTTVLMTGLFCIRLPMILMGKRKANEFAADGMDVSPFTNRLTRAGGNCLENLPVYVGLMVLAIATDSTHITEALALWVLVLRLGQSITHMISTSHWGVFVRATFWFPQVVIGAYWAVMFLMEFKPAM